MTSLGEALSAYTTERDTDLGPLYDWSNKETGDNRGHYMVSLQAQLRRSGIPWSIAKKLLKEAAKHFKDPLPPEDLERHLAACKEYYRTQRKSEGAAATMRALRESSSNLEDKDDEDTELGAALMSKVPPKPDALIKAQDSPFLYEDRLTWMYGDPGSGKSWIALWTANEYVKAGGRVIWIDFEMALQSVSERALDGQLNDITASEDFIYCSGIDFYSERKSKTKKAFKWLDEKGGPTLMVLDSVGAAGGGIDDAETFYEWAEPRISAWREAGHDVLLIDHVAKNNKGNRARTPRNSSAKMAMADVMLDVVNEQADLQLVEVRVEKQRFNDYSSADGIIAQFGFREEHGFIPLTDSAHRAAASRAQRMAEANTERQEQFLSFLADGATEYRKKIKSAMKLTEPDMRALTEYLIKEGKIISTRDNKGTAYRIPPQGRMYNNKKKGKK